MGHHENRLSLAVQPAEQFQDLGATLAVEGTGRLVGQDDRGVVDERPRDRESLPLATGQDGRKLLCSVAEPEQIQGVTSPRHHGRSAQAPEHRSEGNVLEGGDTVQEVEELEHYADVMTTELGKPVLITPTDLLIVDYDRALVWLLEAGEHIQQRRLAATRRSHKRNEFAALDDDVHIAQRPYGSELPR